MCQRFVPNTKTKNSTLLLLLLTIAYMAQSQTIKWVAWAKVSPQTKAELKKVVHSFRDAKPTTVYDEIIRVIKEYNCTISVTTLDVDEDGKPEYGVGFSCSAYCGSSGCNYDFYSENGRKQCNLSSQTGKFRPAKNGIIYAETGRLEKLEIVNWWPQYAAFANEKILIRQRPLQLSLL